MTMREKQIIARIDYAGQADHSKDFKNAKRELAKTMHFSVMYHFANFKVKKTIFGQR